MPKAVLVVHCRQDEKVTCQVCKQPQQPNSPLPGIVQQPTLVIICQGRCFLAFSPRPHFANVNSHNSSSPMPLSGSCVILVFPYKPLSRVRRIYELLIIIILLFSVLMIVPSEITAVQQV